MALNISFMFVYFFISVGNLLPHYEKKSASYSGSMSTVKGFTAIKSVR